MEFVSVVGQGYVGLPLALAAAHAGFKVFGIDTNAQRVSALNNGQPEIADIKESDLISLLQKQQYLASGNFESIQSSKTILVCVPTPLDRSGKPDLTSLTSAIISVAKNLSPESLIIIESSVAPGTTRGTVLDLLLSESGLRKNDFYLAYSPERIDPGNKQWSLRNTPKIVAGLNQESLRRATKFYSNFIEILVECDSMEVAETAKLLENSFRLVNISLINELAIFCQRFGIDVQAVIEAASTKPYGFMPFYPSVGVGGHCVPVDPVYLSEKAAELGVPIKVIELATQINQDLPKFFSQRSQEILGSLEGKKILIIGVSYKPDIADVRETPVKNLITRLEDAGAHVFWHDDLVKKWNGKESVALDGIYDLAILATVHSYIDITKLGNTPVLDTRGSI